MADEQPKTPRKQTAPPFGTKGYLRWRFHMLLAGDRPEDIRMRKRLTRGTAATTGAGLALYFALQFWGVLKPMLTDWPRQQQERDERIAKALERLGDGLDAQAAATKELAGANENVVRIAIEAVRPTPAAAPPRVRRYREGEVER